MFEVPHPEGKPIFVGRAWLFSKLETVFRAGGCGAPDSNGVIITGAQGSGKTAIVEQLINHSCFSEDNTACNSASKFYFVSFFLLPTFLNSKIICHILFNHLDLSIEYK